MKPKKVFPKKKNKGMIILSIVGVVIILSLLSYLLYLKYYSRAVVPTAEVVEIKPEIVVVVEEVVEEEIVIEPEIEPVEIIVEELVPNILSKMHAFDTDKDGLTDSEELLLGTNENKKDTDNDGFQDNTEVVNLYNPLGSDPAKLEFSGLVTTYVNPTYNYDLYYPQKWYARSLDSANREIIITSPMGDFVTINILEKEASQLLNVWYLNKNTDITSNEIRDFTNHNDIEGIVSPDEFTVYFSKDQYIYEIKYDIGLKTKVNYPNLFKVIYESFIFVDSN
jgi:hypothetical protein